MGILVQLHTRMQKKKNAGKSQAIADEVKLAEGLSATNPEEGRTDSAVLLFTGVRYEREKPFTKTPFSKIIANSNYKTR